MRTLLKRRAVVVLAIGSILVAGSAATVLAKTTKKDKTDSATASKGSAPPGVTLNACGCYHTGNSCVCTNKNAKCECPEDCEPVGCEAKRQKEMDREVAEATKRAEDEDKKRQAAEAESERKATESEAAREKAEENGGEDDGTTTDKPADPAAVDKAAEKPAEKPAAKPVHRGRAKKSTQVRP